MGHYSNNKVLTKKENLLHAISIFILGISLGIFSKWLDSLPINDAIPWQKFLGIIDLGNIFSELAIWILLATAISIFSETPKVASINVFLFFVGMNISYHMYTVYVCGFNPQSYMMIWYTITLLSLLLAFLCWYAKKDGKIAIILRISIFTVMMTFAFYVGWGYISLGRILNFVFLAAMVAILWKGSRETSINLLCALVLRVIIGLVFYI